jgi:hypothetical protein
MLACGKPSVKSIGSGLQMSAFLGFLHVCSTLGCLYVFAPVTPPHSSFLQADTDASQSGFVQFQAPISGKSQRYSTLTVLVRSMGLHCCARVKDHPVIQGVRYSEQERTTAFYAKEHLKGYRNRAMLKPQPSRTSWFIFMWPKRLTKSNRRA